MSRNIRTENAADLARALGLPSSIVMQAQKVARIIHRHDERRCNEDLTCPNCQGDGCNRCGFSGDTLGRKDALLLERLRKVVKSYNLRVYEQGDPRGWPLYLIPESSGPVSEDGSYYNMRGFAVCPH